MHFYAASSLCVIRRPTASYYVVSFLGGFSFLGFHFLPKWLMAPLFPFTPAFGPLLLPVAGLLAMRCARGVSQDAALRPGRLFAATLISCAILFVPVAVLEFILFGALPYIGLLVALIALPFHLVCVGVLAAGLYALSKAEGDKPRAALLALPSVAGLLVGIALTVVRFEVVPHSHGIFLKAFAASGSALPLPGNPLDPHGQQDIEETCGAEPRSYHEPIAAIGDDSVWLARRSKQSACSGYWIERKGFAPGGSDWRQCLPINAGLTRNPTAMASDPNSGVFVVGFDVRAGNESWWLKRYDAQGVEDKSWDKSFPNATKIDRAYGVRLARDGSVYVFGESGEIDRRGTFGWVRKFGADGRELGDGWGKRFLNAGEHQPTMAAVGAAANPTGDLYVLLSLYNNYSVRKFDRDGRELWQKALPERKDLAIVADEKGDLLISGAAGYPDQAWIKKLHADGSDAWEKTFALGHLSSALAAALDRAQNVYAAGYGTRPGDKASYWWIKKLSPDGVESGGWDKAIGENNHNIPFALHMNTRDELYVLGKGNGWQFSRSSLERWWGW